MKFLVLCFLVMSSIFAKAQESVVQIGEQLVYEVSYAGINLGSIEIITEPTQNLNGETVNKMKCSMKSYPSIPFVSLNVIYESWMPQSLASSKKFVGIFEDNGWIYQEVIFDNANSQINAQKFRDKKKIESKQMYSTTKWNDGLSIFFLARKFAGNKRSVRIPVYVEDTTYAVINFSSKRENIEIDAVDSPIRTTYLSGNLEFKGVYGLSGKYQGWFSDDAARIPIKAKMNVIVGSVTIELKSWKRKGWSPPLAK